MNLSFPRPKMRPSAIPRESQTDRLSVATPMAHPIPTPKAIPIPKFLVLLKMLFEEVNRTDDNQNAR